VTHESQDATGPDRGDRPPSFLRPLPWGSTDDAKTSFLITDSPDGFLSRIADELELAMLASGEQVLSASRYLLAADHASESELRFALARCVEELGDALRIVASWRGATIGHGLPSETD